MSKIIETWTQWLKNSRFAYMTEEQKNQTINWLMLVRDRILNNAKIKKNDTLIDIGTGTGLLAFEACNKLKESGKVIFADSAQDCLDECKRISKDCGINKNVEFINTDITHPDIKDNSVDVIVMRSVLVHVLDKLTSIKELYRILRPGGRVSFFEPIIKSNTKYYELINPLNFPDYKKLKEVEYKIMSNPDDPLTNFDNKTLEANLIQAGFKNINIDVNVEKSTYTVSASMIEPWFNTSSGGGAQSLKQRFLNHLDEQVVNQYIEDLKKELDGKTITLESLSAYVYAEK